MTKKHDQRDSKQNGRKKKRKIKENHKIKAGNEKIK